MEAGIQKRFIHSGITGIKKKYSNHYEHTDDGERIALRFIISLQINVSISFVKMWDETFICSFHTCTGLFFQTNYLLLSIFLCKLCLIL